MELPVPDEGPDVEGPPALEDLPGPSGRGGSSCDLPSVSELPDTEPELPPSDVAGSSTGITDIATPAPLPRTRRRSLSPISPQIHSPITATRELVLKRGLTMMTLKNL